MRVLAGVHVVRAVASMGPSQYREGNGKNRNRHKGTKGSLQWGPPSIGRENIKHELAYWRAIKLQWGPSQYREGNSPFCPGRTTAIPAIKLQWGPPSIGREMTGRSSSSILAVMLQWGPPSIVEGKCGGLLGRSLVGQFASMGPSQYREGNYSAAIGHLIRNNELQWGPPSIGREIHDLRVAENCEYTASMGPSPV